MPHETKDTLVGAAFPTRKCTIGTDLERRDALTAFEKTAYIDATLCLQKTPSKSAIRGAVTLWDELQYAHVAVSLLDGWNMGDAHIAY